MRTLRLILCAALALSAAACGGGGSSFPLPMSSAQAAAPAPQKVEVFRFDFILRPAPDGRWYIQDDVDHLSMGVMPTIEQGADYLRVTFDRRYTHAGAIQVTSDDDFRDRISGYSNLGVTSATIRIVHDGQVIDPARVHDFVPVGAGNLWVSVTMVNKS